MCEPTLAASLALSALTTYVEFQGAADAADAQEDFNRQQVEENNRMMQQNRIAALRSFEDQTTQEQIRLMQTNEAASEDIQENRRQALEAQGRASASSEAAGTNLDILLGDFLRQDANSRNIISRQLEFEKQQSTANLSGIQAQAEDRINSTTPFIPQPVSHPSLAGAVAGFGIKATNAIDRFSDRSKKTS